MAVVFSLGVGMARYAAIEFVAVLVRAWGYVGIHLVWGRASLFPCPRVVSSPGKGVRFACPSQLIDSIRSPPIPFPRLHS